MKIHEAIMNAGDNWIRPVSWQGAGQAYCIKWNATHIVPSSSGGNIGMTASIDELIEDWEIVSPDVVLGELD